MGSDAHGTGREHVGLSRIPYLLRADERTMRMRRSGGDEWRGCSCPSLCDERGTVLGVLTVCPPDRAMGCGGCTTTSRSSVGFRGPSALATSLVQLSEQGFSDFDLRDDAGELSVRLGLEELVPLLRKGPMPETLPVVALPSSAMPRLGRIVISAVAAPLILVSVMVALIPVMLVLLPLGLVLAPVALLLVPAICSGMRSDWSRQARGIVTEFPVRAEDEQEAEDEEDDDEEDDRYRVRISMPSPEPVRMRVRVSSASGVFSRKIVALTDDDLASVDTEAADEAASAHVA